MKKLFRKINSSKKYFILPLLILAVAVIVLPQAVNAADSSNVTVGGVVVSIVKTLAASPILVALGVISVLVIGVIGAINMMVISFLVNIVQYNNFINEPSIISAWVVVRDLCNMFFILILLVVAFATILRIESYQWKKILPKLLIMAVLINFSRTICGLIIDASQVIMLTFTNAFGTGGNFVDMTQMAKYFTGVTFGDFGTDNFSVLNVVIGMLIGIMFLIISGIVLVVAMSVFFMRIVMLWILLVLSPLAFLAAAFPAGQKYATQWWSEFVKYIINGPVLAFFIWMALITSQQKVAFFTQGDAAASLAKQCFGSSQIMCMGTFMPFILSIGMLIGGLMITQQIGGVGSSVAGKGLDWAKKSAKFVGGAVGYIPAQYAKRVGYGLGDMALGQLSKVPIIGNLAMEGKGRLRMHRDFAEEKDTKYMQYMEEQDLDRVIARQRSTSIISTLGKGMESKRQMFKRALVEKMKRGDEWGQTKEAKMANKTRAMIDLAQIGRHSITSSGEDAFRDADLLKLWHEFRNKNAGMIDDTQMRDYFFGNEGNVIGPNGERTGQHYNYKSKKPKGNAANSEYYRVGGWKDDKTGYWYEKQGADGKGVNFISPDSMLAYTGMRQRMNEFHGMHHENYGAWTDKAGNEHYDYLDAVYDEGNGPMKSFAQIRDRGTRQQKVALRGFMKQRLEKETAERWKGSTKFKEAYESVHGAGATTPEKIEEFLNLATRNRGIGGDHDAFGASRPIMGQTHSVEAASGITGLGRINHGVMAASFGELGLESSAAKYFDGADKAKIANRIGGSLRDSGIAEDVAKAVEDQINQASYLILHNKDAGVSPSETRTAHAHELMHARVGANFSQDELKGVWNSMDENSRNGARKQISAKWGANMSEDAIMNEYFAEGLTAKTRWGKGAVVSLNQTAESGLDGLLKSKGSNINAFTSNVYKTRPTSNDISQSMASNIDGSLKKTLEELIGTLKDVGDGFSSIERFSSSLDTLQRYIGRNQTILEKNTKGYKNVTEKLNNLANRAT